MKDFKSEQTAIIIGAGPAGLTAARELLEAGDIRPVVIEQDTAIGGLSQTVAYKGNRMDIGGHRFFSKSQRVNDFWQRLMPMQGAPAQDDLLTGRKVEINNGGSDPETTDRVMLRRNRVSRIYHLRHFFDYPISLKWQTFANMGLGRTLRAATGYARAVIFRRKEESLEDFYINRFGKPLYRMFFEDYTEKVWGIHPSRLGADWGAQRVKGVSVIAILKDMLKKCLGLKGKGKVETSLIESFTYPKYGPGQLWETAAEEIKALGGEIRTRTRATAIHIKGKRVTGVDVMVSPDGQTEHLACDHLLSSMPIRDLVAAIRGIEVPAGVRRIAEGLAYRDFITVGLLVERLAIENHTSIRTFANRVPDTWIYIQEKDVRIGRLQIFNNWSPYLLSDYEHTMWIGLEYFCTEGDDLWTMPKDEFVRMAIGELRDIGIISSEADVLDSTQVKIRKAYPSYFGTYHELSQVREFLDSIDNLYCIGRNGQHRYNNMDHSMLTAMEAAQAIRKGNGDKAAIWAVNTEETYHESK